MTAVLEAARVEVLDRIAAGQGAAELLTPICAALEQALPGSTVGVTILDRSKQIFESAVFPSLPPAYAAALHGIAVADRPGSCAHAIYDGERVTSNDVANDARFAPAWKDLCLVHGMRALTSIPALHPEGFALGTLVVTFDPAKPLTGEHDAMIGEALGIVAAVLTYLRRQQRQELLMGELRHRIGNVFATIGAMVYSTLRHNPDTTAFRATFDGRLKALAQAHTLALEPKDPDLGHLLGDLLAPYMDDHAVSFAGPRILLTQEAAFAIGMATHELATNAVKYGALSRSGGSVDIAWDYEGPKRDRFALRWTERGGPEVHPPKRKGYGERTIRGTLASAFDAVVEMDYAPAGFACHIKAPHSPRLGSRLN